MKRVLRKLPHVRRKHRPEFRNRPAPGEKDVLKTSPDASPTTVRIMAYDAERLIEEEGADAARIAELKGQCGNVWIDVAGLADLPLIQKLCGIFGVHPLAQEDVVRTHQRSKVEEYAEHLFIVARMAPTLGEEETEQLSLFFGDGYVLTFQERPGDDLDGVRQRLRNPRSRLRHLQPDHLVYSILDAIIDAYFPLLEKSGERLELLEDELISRPANGILQEIYAERRKLLKLRRSLWPLRELASALLRGESGRFTQETRVYLRDCYDHTVQLIDLMEVYRELSSGLMDVYLSTISNRLNEVMKVLTIITVIFIPLSFVAGVYGMNFHTDESRWNMPELRWRYGYLACLAFMALIAAGEIYYFRRKGWIGRGPDFRDRADN